MYIMNRHAVVNELEATFTLILFCVVEGGRLEQELQYTRTTVGEGRGITSQLVIQTPKSDANILTVPSLQFHLETLRKVTEISVDMFEV